MSGEKFMFTERSIPLLQQDLIDHANSYYSNKDLVRVFGRRLDIDDIRVALWEGPTADYVPPAAGMQMRVISTSANDTASGTGMRKVHIHYLDSNYIEHTETVTLNGLTEVLTTATDIFRINASHAWEVGSSGTSEGTISITNTAGTVTYDIIAAGYNYSRKGFYTVPAERNLYISHWQASSGSTGSHFARVALRATSHYGTLMPGVFNVVDEAGSQNGGQSITFPTPIRIPSMADVKFSAISDSASANVTAMGAFMGWLE